MPSVTLLNGHVLPILQSLLDESVHCCITSPPYWALRDYGLEPQVWGGKAGCSHVWGEEIIKDKRGLQLGKSVSPDARGSVNGSFCRLCNAWRGSYGLEPTIGLYIEHTVQIFREVKRVLRPDGCMFLNLGSSYASGGRTSYDVDPKLPNRGHSSRPGSSGSYGKQPSQSLPGVLPYGTYGKGQSDLQENDYVCPGPDDECQADSQNRHGRTSHICSQPPLTGEQPWQKGHDNGHQGCASKSLGVLLPGAPGSTKPEFWLQLRDGCLHSDNPFSCPSFSDSCFPAIQGNAHKELNICGKPGPSGTSVDHTQDRELFSKAYTAPNSLIRDSLTKVYPNVKFKPKDLIMVPAMVALALQADGWWLRSEITWCKKAPMPESCQDRPTSATEKIFLLTKSSKYFYDGMGYREPSTGQNGAATNFQRETKDHLIPNQSAKQHRNDRKPTGDSGTHNLWNYWVLSPESFPAAHFAVFPQEIPLRAILLGTSERGCCPKCFAPWKRMVKKSGGTTGKDWNTHDRGKADLLIGATQSKATTDGTYRVETTGWAPTCTCNAGEPQPCTVLDPFSGAGTTALVAAKLGRDAIGIELSEPYVLMSEKRIRSELGMLATIEIIRDLK